MNTNTNFKWNHNAINETNIMQVSQPYKQLMSQHNIPHQENITSSEISSLFHHGS